MLTQSDEQAKVICDLHAQFKQSSDKWKRPDHHCYVDKATNNLGSKGRICAIVALATFDKTVFRSQVEIFEDLKKKYPYSDRKHHSWLYKTKKNKTAHPDGSLKNEDYLFYYTVLNTSQKLHASYHIEIDRIENILLELFVEKRFNPQNSELYVLQLKNILRSNLSDFKSALVALLKKVYELGFSAPLQSLIDSELAGVVYEEDSGALKNDHTKEAFDSIYSYLLEPSENLTFCISGSVHSGRTSLLRTVFDRFGVRLDGSECPGIIKHNPQTEQSSLIPICALSCHQKTYEETLGYLENFFGIGIDDFGPAIGIDEQLRRIRQSASKQAVVYIFTNIDLNDLDRSQSHIRGQGIVRLLNTLGTAHSENKILVTNSKPIADFFPDQSKVKIRDISLKDRSYKELLTFFEDNDSVRKQINSIMLERPNLAKKAISGALLSFVAGAIRILANLPCSHSGPSQNSQDISFFTQLLGDFASRNEEDVNEKGDKTRDAEVELSKTVWDRIKPVIVEMNPALDWALPHIAASDDGLSISSLRSMFMRRHTGKGTIDEAFQEFLVALNKLREVTRGHLLYRSTASIINDLEITPEDFERSACLSDQNNTLNAPDHRILFSLDPLAAVGLMRAVRYEKPTRYREVYRTIARLARDRSSLIKLQMEGVYGQRKADMRRDLLAYVALLASLDEGAIQKQISPPIDAILANHELQVFASNNSDLGSKVTDAERLAFAYHALLERDIDRDYRLTMRLDEDKLRLNLYLQMFQGVGLRKRGSAIKHEPLPDQIPAYLKSALKLDAIADLLTSIAVSALYADNVVRLYEVISLAKNYWEELRQIIESGGKQAAVASRARVRLFRLWEAEIDALFLGYVFPGNDIDGCWKDLEKRIAEIKNLYSEEQKKNSEINQKLDLHKLRLDHARGINVNEHQNEAQAYIERSASIYERHRLQDFALSGRPARRLIKVLVGEVGVFGDDTLDSQSIEKSLHISRNLLRLNIARLSQFKGGDRVGILIDCALIELLRGKYINAIAYSERASDEIAYSSISRGLQADRLWHQAVCLIVPFFAKGSDDPVFSTTGLSRDYAEEGLRKLDALIALSEDCFPYYFVIAHLLRRKTLAALGKLLTNADDDAWWVVGAYIQHLDAPRLKNVKVSIDSALARE